MEVTAELREKINRLSPEKLEQFRRYIDFLFEEAKRKKMIVNDSAINKTEKTNNSGQ